MATCDSSSKRRKSTRTFEIDFEELIKSKSKQSKQETKIKKQTIKTRNTKQQETHKNNYQTNNKNFRIINTKKPRTS
jgi:hypothetical protein